MVAKHLPMVAVECGAFRTGRGELVFTPEHLRTFVDRCVAEYEAAKSGRSVPESPAATVHPNYIFMSGHAEPLPKKGDSDRRFFVIGEEDYETLNKARREWRESMRPIVSRQAAAVGPSIAELIAAGRLAPLPPKPATWGERARSFLRELRPW